MSIVRAFLVGASLALSAACTTAIAQQPSPQPTMQRQASVASPYGAMSFLIGEWDTSDASGRAFAVQRFRWGANQSYIWFATSTLTGDHEAIHFEGMFVWNFANNNADFLVVLEPGSGSQERGTLHAEADGLIVRDVLATDARGHTQTFRQTFRRTGENTAVTSLMRRKADGTWEPNFPGSDNLIMTRRPA
jgi:hypothetical protein